MKTATERLEAARTARRGADVFRHDLLTNWRLAQDRADSQLAMVHVCQDGINQLDERIAALEAEIAAKEEEPKL